MKEKEEEEEEVKLTHRQLKLILGTVGMTGLKTAGVTRCYQGKSNSMLNISAQLGLPCLLCELYDCQRFFFILEDCTNLPKQYT